MSTPYARPRSRVELEKFALAIREKLCPNQMYFDIIRFVEVVLTTLDPSFGYEYVSESEMPNNTYAYYNPTTNIMRIADNVYERACSDIGRDRFTIAHEVAHYFLHRGSIAFTRSESIPKYCDPEWQANVFASALLIPHDRIQKLSVTEISNKCKVSYQAAEIAKRNLA